MSAASEVRCAVLLRGVNVGKHKRIAMGDLRRLLEGLGCRDVQTYLQSGNAVVTTAARPTDSPLTSSRRCCVT